MTEEDSEFLHFLQQKCKSTGPLTAEDVEYLRATYLFDDGRALNININVQDPGSGYTALMYACQIGNMELIQLFLSFLPVLDLNLVNAYGTRALDISYGLNDADICSLLEESGAHGAHLEGIILSYCA
jgi:hypothetical protein